MFDGCSVIELGWHQNIEENFSLIQQWVFFLIYMHKILQIQNSKKANTKNLTLNTYATPSSPFPSFTSSFSFLNTLPQDSTQNKFTIPS